MQEDVTFALKMVDRGIERAKQLQNGQSPWTSQKGKVALGFYSPLDGSVQPLLLTIPAAYDGKPTRLDIVLHGRSQRLIESNWICYDPSPANAQTGERLLHARRRLVSAADAESLDDRRLERRAVSARSLCARQQRQSLGRRGRRVRVDGRRPAAIQDRRLAARAARVLARRSGCMAPRASSSGSLGCRGNRRGHVAASLPDDGRVSAASAADAAHLGEHDRVGAECLQHSDCRSRRRQRHAGRVDSASARRRADARPARVVDQNSRTAREGRLPVRGRADELRREGHAEHLPDFRKHRTQHQSEGAPAARRIPEGMDRPRAPVARSHSISHLHDALQQELLGDASTASDSTTSAPRSMRGVCRAERPTRSRRRMCRGWCCARPTRRPRFRSTVRRCA